MDPVLREILQRLKRLEQNSVTLAYGDVTDASGPDVDLDADGTAELTSVGALAFLTDDQRIAILKAGGDRLVLGGLTDSWHLVAGTDEPAFENSWVNFGGIFPVASFIRDGDGFVHIRGLVKSGTANSTVFTLPAGYRPEYPVDAIVASGDTSGTSQVRISTSGTVATVLRGSTTATHLLVPPFRAFA